MPFKKILQYIALALCIALVASCFLPWTHYNSINVTFNGFNVKPFSTGVYYGRAGLVISIITGISFLLTIIPTVFAKRANMFVCALLLAYTLRTYVIFTGSIFAGEVVTYFGLYLVNILAALILVCSIFPYLKKEDKKY
jgi:hypothetical protein